MLSIFTYDLDGQTIRAKCRAQSATECSQTTAIGTRLKRNFAFAPSCFHPKTPSPPDRPPARRNLLCARDRAAARHPVCDSISAVFWAISMFDTSDKRRHNGFTCVCVRAGARVAHDGLTSHSITGAHASRHNLIMARGRRKSGAVVVCVCVCMFRVAFAIKFKRCARCQGGLKICKLICGCTTHTHTRTHTHAHAHTPRDTRSNRTVFI